MRHHAWRRANPRVYWGKKHGSAGLLLFSGDRVLLTLRSGDVNEPGTWGIPGGALHEGDAPLEAATREVQEELCGDPSSDDRGRNTVDEDGWPVFRRKRRHGEFEDHELREIPPHNVIGEVIYQDGTFRYTTFLARMEPDEARSWEIVLNWENDEVRWVPTSELVAMQDNGELHFGLEYVMDQRPDLFRLEARSNPDDEESRLLERRAATGDQQAAVKLARREARRTGVELRRTLLSLIQEFSTHGGTRPAMTQLQIVRGDIEPRHVAAGIRSVLHAAGAKTGLSVKTEKRHIRFASPHGFFDTDPELRGALDDGPRGVVMGWPTEMASGVPGVRVLAWRPYVEIVNEPWSGLSAPRADAIVSSVFEGAPWETATGMSMNWLLHYWRSSGPTLPMSLWPAFWAGIERGMAGRRRNPGAYDLDEILRDVDERFFHGRLRPLVSSIRWSRKPLTSRWAVWKTAPREIELNVLLDEPSVPRFVIEYQVFHEGLHALLPRTSHSHHGRAFRLAEMAFPQLSEVRRWERDRAQAFLVNDDMMRAGLDRYGRRYGLSSTDAGQVVTTMTGTRARVLGWLQGSVALEDVATGRKFAISPKGAAILLSRARGATP